MNLVEIYYDGQAENEWQRLERHRMEFSMTMRALEEYLPLPPQEVLDIGGGPGRYTIALAKQGYHVTLADLSTSCLKLAEQKAGEARVTIKAVVRANAMELAQFSAESFGIVLLMGPLYHLLEADDRKPAVREAWRVLKPGGYLVVSFITRFAPFHDSARENPGLVTADPAYAWRLLHTGRHDNGVGFTRAYFTHPDEVEPLMKSVGLKTVQILGVEGVTSDNEELINQLSGAEWDLWVDLNYAMGKDPYLWGASNHLLYIGTK